MTTAIPTIAKTEPLPNVEIRVFNGDLDDRKLDATVRSAERGNLSAQRKLAGKRVHETRGGRRPRALRA